MLKFEDFLKMYTWNVSQRAPFHISKYTSDSCPPYTPKLTELLRLCGQEEDKSTRLAVMSVHSDNNIDTQLVIT